MKTKNPHGTSFAKSPCPAPALLNVFSVFGYLGLHSQHVEVPRLGVKSELQLLAYTTPQQLGIQASSVTYTTAHGNSRFVTH